MSGRVLIVPVDGKLPNLALMRLAAWERGQGAHVTWRHQLPTLDLFTPSFDRVYGSAIFGTSTKAVAKLRAVYPHAVIGGSGGDDTLRVEDIVPSHFTGLDYSGYPDFTASIGYAMRGCRMNCAFCVVPGMEGKARSAASIATIWRGPGFPKHVHLLDNDFFGNPSWKSVRREIVDGSFKVCINQGINVRIINDEAAEAIAEMHPWDDGFERGRLYAAWDNIGDERVFFRGIDRLERAGWKASWVFAYMLIGFDPGETWDRIHHRLTRMTERGIRPYPMVFGGDANAPRPREYQRLKRFQRWVLRRDYMHKPFDQWEADEYLAPSGRLAA